jgi:hypothetical protein
MTVMIEDHHPGMIRAISMELIHHHMNMMTMRVADQACF